MVRPSSEFADICGKYVLFREDKVAERITWGEIRRDVEFTIKQWELGIDLHMLRERSERMHDHRFRR